MKSWQVGDRAILVGLCCNTYLNGLECEILELWSTTDGSYRIDIDGHPPPSGSRYRSTHPTHLRPIPDDKHERFHQALIKREWSDCEFNPMVTVEIDNEH